MQIYNYKFLLEKILKTSDEKLHAVLEGIEYAYEETEIPKKNGIRVIHMLRKTPEGRNLTNFQRNLVRRFLQKIPIAIPAKGFVTGESYQNFLMPHAGNYYFLRIDIKDFFDLFSEKLMMSNLKEFIQDREALETVFELCTLNAKLPQGAVTSPILSNIFFRRIDQRILKYCQSIEERYRKENTRSEKQGIRRISYTRYADDMLFSSDFFDFGEHIYFLRMLSKILKENGFEINRSKTMMCKGEIGLNGYVVGDGLRLSRRKLQSVKETLYFFRKQDQELYEVDMRKAEDLKESLKKLNETRRENNKEAREFRSRQDFIHYLAGCRAWMISVLQTEQLLRKDSKRLEKTIQRLEELLKAVEKEEG